MFYSGYCKHKPADIGFGFRKYLLSAEQDRELSRSRNFSPVLWQSNSFVRNLSWTLYEYKTSNLASSETLDFALTEISTLALHEISTLAMHDISTPAFLEISALALSKTLALVR